jgi:hypothetical protein
MSFARRFLLAAVGFAFSLLSSRGAAAQTDDGTGGYMSHRPHQSPQNFAFELRFGPYAPQVDQDFPSATPPYQGTFGTRQRLYFGLELDWQALRIPMFGTLGPGVGWGYTHMSTTAKASHPELVKSNQVEEDTTLGIMPMYAVAVLRMDLLARETNIPLVAYGKAGVGYGLFWMGNDLEVQARGHSWGTHFALGGMLLLDNFDPHSATQLDEEVGINNSYLYFEWMFANLGSKGDLSTMDIGTSTWNMGLALEF